MFQTKVAEKIKKNKHFILSKLFFRKACCLCDNVEKYDTARQATDEYMEHVHCMLDIYGCKYTLRICNTNCFSTATMVERTRLNVTLYVHCMSTFTITLTKPIRNNYPPHNY